VEGSSTKTPTVVVVGGQHMGSAMGLYQGSTEVGMANMQLGLEECRKTTGHIECVGDSRYVTGRFEGWDDVVPCALRSGRFEGWGVCLCTPTVGVTGHFVVGKKKDARLFEPRESQRGPFLLYMNFHAVTGQS